MKLNELICQLFDHNTKEIATQVFGARKGYMRVVDRCSRCGVDIENPHYEMRDPDGKKISV
jgi:hypothetical protein